MVFSPHITSSIFSALLVICLITKTTIATREVRNNLYSINAINVAGICSRTKNP
ncbi:hypothetical protein MKX03_029533, partial [Papaver bracteatum]